MAGNGSLKEFVHEAALGAIAAASADMFLEVSRFPVANDPLPSTLQPPGEQWSVAEGAILVPSAIAVAIGLIDVVGGKSLLPGYGRHLLGYGGGAILGVTFYENNIAKWLGIRDTS